VSPLDVEDAIPIAHAGEFHDWLRDHGRAEREVVVGIFNRASRRQTVSLVGLQEVALCHGWVDTQTKRIDAERYAIRFVPRRPGSHWSGKNREMARRLLEAGQIHDAGLATLPPDLRPDARTPGPPGPGVR
jgi:uncharacterized protein YdeI (YjbR/CyaY-like superfamily)